MIQSVHYRHAFYWILASLVFVICIPILKAQAASPGNQRISIIAEDLSYREVFNMIQKKTGFWFMYTNEDVNQEKRISFNVRDMSLDGVIAILLSKINCSWQYRDKTIIIKKLKNSELAPEFTLHGKVIDENGKPVQNATVQVKGYKKGAQTNSEGLFILSFIKEKSVLIISSVGYETIEHTVINDNPILLQLKTLIGVLDEVQMIAYGQTLKRHNVGNVTTIKAEQIEKQPINNPLLALQGRVPGLTIAQTSGLPGAPVTVQIRGKNSLNGSEPLYIVDGLPFSNNVSGLGGPYQFTSGIGTQLSAFNFINPGDIESIEILKDADATAIYGSRGANGVILITTKKGRTGSAKVDVNMQTGWGNITRNIELLNTKEYLEMRREAILNDDIRIDNLSERTRANRYPDIFVYDSTRYTDWQKELIGGTAHYNDIQASISGGTINTQYLIGANFHKETTVFPGESADQKANAHFSITGNSPNQKFSATLTGSYMSNWTNYPRVDFTNAVTLSPNAPSPFKEDGSLNWGYRVFATGNPVYSFISNPYARLYQPYKARINNLTTSASVGYAITRAIMIKTNIGYNELRGNSYIAVNPFVSLPNPTIFDIRESNFNINEVRSFIIEPQITYITHISKGVLNVLAGGSYQNSSAATQAIAAKGANNDNLMESLASANSYTLFNTSSQYRYNAIFGRLTYEWEGRYFFNVNVRRDGSSRFGPGKQFGNFGSIGAAWIFSQENFIKSTIPFISFGKLRASYGTAGNDGIGNYQYLERYANVDGTYQGVKGLASLGLYNPFYSWEVTRKAEIGIEMGYLKDRLILQVSYYQNRSSNQLAGYPLPSISGPGSVTYNLPALIQNSGIELSINTINIKGKDFTWTNAFNISVNRNKLLEFPGLGTIVSYPHLRINEPLGMIRTYHMVGVDPETGQYQFTDASGKVTFNPRGDENKTEFINTSPKFFGGFSNSISYKGITLDIFFQFTKQTGKNYLYSFTGYPGISNTAIANQPKEVLNRWRKSGDNSQTQRFTTGVNNPNPDASLGDAFYEFALNSDKSYSDASFVRLKNFSVSYSLSKLAKQKLHIQNLRVYIQGQNLFTITKYKGFDPENQSVTSLPPLRILTTGLQISL